MTPMIVITTINSISVKPFSAERVKDLKPALLPVANVGIFTVASLGTVCA